MLLVLIYLKLYRFIDNPSSPELQAYPKVHFISRARDICQIEIIRENSEWKIRDPACHPLYENESADILKALGQSIEPFASVRAIKIRSRWCVRNPRQNPSLLLTTRCHVTLNSLPEFWELTCLATREEEATS